MKNLILVIFLLITTTGCVSKRVPLLNDDEIKNIKPSNIKEALITTESILLSQRSNWDAPSMVYFSQDAFILDYGTSTTGSSSDVSIGNTTSNSVGNYSSAYGHAIGISFGKTSSDYKTTADVRKFFYTIVNPIVSIKSWRHKFKQWYIVYFDNLNNSENRVLYTRNVNEALKLKYSLEYIIWYQTIHLAKGTIKLEENDNDDEEKRNNINDNIKFKEIIEIRLNKLKSLYDKGLITEDIYHKKESHILKDL